jgi:hypothetical protein
VFLPELRLRLWFIGSCLRAEHKVPDQQLRI